MSAEILGLESNESRLTQDDSGLQKRQTERKQVGGWGRERGKTGRRGEKEGR